MTLICHPGRSEGSEANIKSNGIKHYILRNDINHVKISLPCRQHIPDSADLPYSFVRNNYKAAPHFANGAISVLYFIFAINNGTG